MPKIASKSFPRGLWAGLGQPLGGPWAPRPVLERFWGPFGGAFLAFKIVQNSPQNEHEIEHRFGTMFLASGSRRGSSLGPFWGSFGGHFGVDFRPPGAITDFSKKRARASAGARFSRFGGSKKEAKIDPKTPPKSACRSVPAPRASRRPLERLLGSIWGSEGHPKLPTEPLQKQHRF